LVFTFVFGPDPAGPDATVSQNVPKSPSTLPSRAPEDLQTRNSSGAESSAPLSTAEAQEQPAAGNILGQSKAAGSERAFSAGRGTGGVEVGSEAVKALGRARSPLYESKHQRPRSSGGPPLHKEMADAMIARAGDWSGIYALSMHLCFVRCLHVAGAGFLLALVKAVSASCEAQ
jgi:hypothetical protein